MTEYLQFASRPRVIGACFLLTVLLLYAMSPGVFPPSIVQPFTASGESGFSVTSLAEAKAALGQAHNLFRYALCAATLDMLFPLVYVTLLCGLLCRAMHSTRFAPVLAAPMALGIWDYLENMQLIGVHLGFPAIPDGLIRSVIFFGIIKLLAATLLIAITAMAWLYRLFRVRAG